MLASWVRTPWASIMALCVGWLAVIGTNFTTRRTLCSALLLIHLGAAVGTTAGFACERPFTWDEYYALVAACNAIGLLLALPRFRRLGRDIWGKWLTLGWTFTGMAVLLATSYVSNARILFHLYLALAALFLVLIKRLLPLRPVLIQGTNTLLLLLVGLPLADLFIRPHYELSPGVGLAKKYYLYESARRDPEAFAHWWKIYLKEWEQLCRQVFGPDPSGKVNFGMKPNSRGKFFESQIRINGLGFRGPEIAEAKGAAYRIVALGESTTFGCTLYEHDLPWPRLLENIIRKQLCPARPVEVINAGVPAYDLRRNLKRLKAEVLPLKPDLIISYHGVNGYKLLADSMPRPHGPPPPQFKPRPLRLLADSEYRLRMLAYRRNHMVSLNVSPPDLSKPFESEYAQAYRELIRIGRSNKIHIALANFSLAVNGKSDLEVAEFYRKAAPSLHWAVKANSAHNFIVRELARQNEDVTFVNTRPGLDGHPEMFVDLGHMTQAGRKQIAENIFKAIKPLLMVDLSSTSVPRN